MKNGYTYRDLLWTLIGMTIGAGVTIALFMLYINMIAEICGVK